MIQVLQLKPQLEEVDEYHLMISLVIYRRSQNLLKYQCQVRSHFATYLSVYPVDRQTDGHTKEQTHCRYRGSISVCVSVNLFVCCPSVCFFISLLVHQSACLSVRLSVNLFVLQFGCPLVCLSVRLSVVCPSVCSSVCQTA